MEMTNEEIVYRYRNAAQRNQQIQILAELNLCERETIVQILEDAGEEVPKRKYNKKKKAEPKEEKAIEPIKLPEIIEKPIPDFIAQILLEKLDEIDGKLATVEKEKKEYESQYYAITNYLGITRAEG